MEKILLIDTFNFLHRAYHALPKTFTDKEGVPTNAVYGFSSMLLNVFDLIKPEYAVAAIDDASPTFRVESFTGYKAHRRPMEDDLSVQLPKINEVLDAFGIKKIMLPGYEADDVIGTISKKYSALGYQVIIVSNDRDMWQLIDSNVMVMNPGTKGVTEWIGEKEVIARMGFTPAQIPDYKGLRGDPSDNIPGVYGIGDKTAKELIIEYKTIENIYQNIGKVSSEGLRKKLSENYEQAIMSKNLACIITDVPFSFEIAECAYKGSDSLAIKDILTKFNFKSLLRRLGYEAGNDVMPAKKPEVDPNQLKLF